MVGELLPFSLRPEKGGSVGLCFILGKEKKIQGPKGDCFPHVLPELLHLGFVAELGWWFVLR